MFMIRHALCFVCKEVGHDYMLILRQVPIVRELSPEWRSDPDPFDERWEKKRHWDEDYQFRQNFDAARKVYKLL